MGDEFDLEALAAEALARANADDEDPPSVFELIEKILGTKVRRPAHLVTAGALARVGETLIVAVKASLPIQRAHHVAGHELGHALIREARLRCDDEERAADYLGACLMMPRRYVEKLYRCEGFAPAILAGEVVATQTAAALRIGEVIGMPLAAVSPRIVRVRGAQPFEWGGEERIRELANKRRLGPGIARTRLTDEKGRFALVADEDIGETG
jgi:hypothetical protein